MVHLVSFELKRFSSFCDNEQNFLLSQNFSSLFHFELSRPTHATRLRSSNGKCSFHRAATLSPTSWFFYYQSLNRSGKAFCCYWKFGWLTWAYTSIQPTLSNAKEFVELSQCKKSFQTSFFWCNSV